uniref:Coiled-coil domain containing 9 n=1 Tax=Astyanax mexicanus TaxID=7994 RepID=A0A8B9L5Q5_ASTMX
MSAVVDLKTKEEKDAELDRRIEALRKKNEALVRRYQEIEEDKKKAEQEGIAVTTPRKPRTHEPDPERRKIEKENFTVTVDLGGEGRGGEGRGGEGRGGEGRGGLQQGGAGSDRKSKEWEEKRRQNIEKMNEEMEKIAEYERGQRADGEKNPIRNFLDDPRRSGPIPDIDRKEGSRRHVRNWGGLDFDNVKTGAEVEKEWTSRRPGGKGSMDMTLSMTGRERAEYLRWKKEREQIDEERLARHRNATGQWRREWDAQKTEKISLSNTKLLLPAEDGKRPPKVPTFGDFLGQGKPRREERNQGGHGRGKGRGQGKSYSMHDNRWEGEKEEEKGKKEEQEKEKKEEEKPKAPPEKVKVLLKVFLNKWEEEEEEEEGEEKCKDEEKDSQKDSKPTGKSSGSPAHSTPSPRGQRTPRPRVRIPSPQETLSTPEPTKPLSPFTPLDGHQPVSDWGEEMETLSPKSSLGESPLRPSSTESSPNQNKSREGEGEEQEEGGGAGDAANQPAESETQDNYRYSKCLNNPQLYPGSDRGASYEREVYCQGCTVLCVCHII